VTRSGFGGACHAVNVDGRDDGFGFDVDLAFGLQDFQHGHGDIV